MTNHSNECIFCRSTSNSFLSVEHIFPESLGNKEKILPRGFVCDKCNNGVLATLDQELTEFDPIKFLRTIYGVENKIGKVPISSFQNVVIKNPERDHITIDSQSNKNIEDKTEDSFKINFRGNKKMDSGRLKLLARSLYKIGFELMTIDHGKGFILSDKYNEIREIILGTKDFNGYLVIGSNKTPEKTGMKYNYLKDTVTQKEFALFDFNYFFIRIFFDMERRQSKLEKGIKIDGFTLFKF